MKAAALLFCLALSGCAIRPPRPGPPRVTADTLQMSEDFGTGAQDWLTEAKKRFPHPFIVAVHGSQLMGKVWWLAPDDDNYAMPADALAYVLHSLMPDRQIIFSSCNQDGFELHVSGVWYVQRLVRKWPTSQPSNSMATGIWEFREGRP